MSICPITKTPTCHYTCKFSLNGGCAILMAARQSTDNARTLEQLKREIANLGSKLNYLAQTIK